MLLPWLGMWTALTFPAPALGQSTNHLDTIIGRIQLRDGEAAPSRKISLDDIVSRRDLQEIRLSPDGRLAAIAIRQGFRDSNSYRFALYLLTTTSPRMPRKLLEEKSPLTCLRWSPDGRTMSYLSSRAGSAEIWGIDPRIGRPYRILPRRTALRSRAADLKNLGNPAQPPGITSYEWSPDGKAIAFTSPSVPAEAEVRRVRATGAIYDDERMTYIDLVTQKLLQTPAQLWTFNTRSGQTRMIWQARDQIASLAWSPDGSTVAVSYLAPAVQRESMVFYNYDIGLVSIAAHTFRPIATGEASETSPTWSPDGRALAFISDLDVKTSSVDIVEISTARRTRLGYGQFYEVSHVWWGTGVGKLLFEAPDSGTMRRGKSTLYEAFIAGGDIRPIATTSGHLSACSFSTDYQRAACVLQSPTSPPDPAIADMRTGEVRVIASLNPEWRHIRLGEVTELHWKNKYGDETNGFLIKPTDYVDGARYPVLVIVYGFAGKFAAEAEWITSYPAQAFAREGFAVLLANYPRSDSWPGKDFARGTQAEGWSPLASLERGAELLVERGIADSTRLGIMGWSYGCFLAEFAMTQSRRFSAAAVGAGGDYNPGIYWLLGRRSLRYNYERVMGGPPYGLTLKNWLAFSPALRADMASGPFLMEFSSIEAVFGLEMYTALRDAAIPVELVVYPDEGHILDEPEHRYYSMQRNLDWFTFWLQGKVDSAPSKRAQYQRWERMKRGHTELGDGSGPNRGGMSR